MMISTKELIKKRILLIGSNGMLGQRLMENLIIKKDIELLCSSVEGTSFIQNVNYIQSDITDKNKVKNIIGDFYPDFIINTAAYTDVDGCETEKDLSWKINVTGVENLARFAGPLDSHLIHISSDYVFDGSNGPYSEEDIPNPVSYYGRTKLASENALHSVKLKYTIIRTNVLYGPAKFGRPDFVKWVVSSLRDNKTIRIVDDQINNPTYIDDLVFAINQVIEFTNEGVYNIGGAEVLSRYEFTIRIADFFNLDKNLISKIKTEVLNQPAPRPLNSGLINLKAQTELDYKPRSIEETFLLMKKELNL